ncbi:MAG: tRNA glutamyl-Q(34) synthetase GluQRS [Reyranella sp.]|uniref:tRNA glutamyl-Q(34) synthetase GluQRS n=1 Tax=Reyranella sp. TaxID=1929291 RepID=UPI002730B2AB|nr:tRNA glutamyl-Q(34) synthetase GluQRS [Reyranella sp.]MDP1965555.1 tRNA glutamyl-Q(34) synthetase GluQRS [Reyranella sp.]MDP2372597.1 tRNA glutamyl-Q(34) synthetase GluQRS [Reyranella sp.]
MPSVVTRFAPSPTGLLHLGSAYSALVAWTRAREAGGRFLVRIEDTDIRRCRREYETAILQDLKWLGLDWDGEARRQSDHFSDYGHELDRLGRRGLVYPCFCSRAEIEREIAASASAPHSPPLGPDGPLYPGTCRHLAPAERKRRIAAGREFCMRLDSAAAAADTGPYDFVDEGRGRITGQPLLMGDFVIARKDTPTSYHLAVTVDDHLQGVTLVTRGEDILPSTHAHVLLQRLLGYATPLYAHHGLIIDRTGRRLAKRDQATGIRSLRESGKTPADVFKLIGAGLEPGGPKA